MTRSRAILALLVSATLLVSCSRVSAAERRAVDRYTTTIAPLSQEGGRIVVVEIRPGLGDLTFGRITPAEFRRRASGWKSGMESVRRRFAEAPAPGRLRRIADTFDESFVLYLRAIDLFVQASAKAGDELKSAISAAVPTAERADKVYDRAVARLKQERKRVGLPEVSVP